MRPALSSVPSYSVPISLVDLGRKPALLLLETTQRAWQMLVLEMMTSSRRASLPSRLSRHSVWRIPPRRRRTRILVVSWYVRLVTFVWILVTPKLALY